MANLSTILQEAFETYPSLERVVIYVFRSIKLPRPIGELTSHFLYIEGSFAVNATSYENAVFLIDPILNTFPVDSVSLDKHCECITIQLNHIVEEE